jgi:hypothetical protein
MLIQTASLMMASTLSRAWLFLASSDPVHVPHQCCELSLWQCLERARAPTDSLALGLCGAVNVVSRMLLEGGRQSMLPAVFLTPSRSRTPRTPKLYRSMALFMNLFLTNAVAV